MNPVARLVRPEIRARLWRWREALAGLGALLLGLWWVLAGLGIVFALGLLLCAIGAGLILAGWQRARFRRGGSGAGVVDVTERQIAYFGPLSGGVVATEMIGAVALARQPGDGPAWELHHGGGDVLRIPVGAAGAEALFDVFETLPGLKMEPLLAALDAPDDLPRMLWTRPRSRLH